MCRYFLCSPFCGKIYMPAPANCAKILRARQKHLLEVLLAMFVGEGRAPSIVTG
jgi:hypothetical protein